MVGRFLVSTGDSGVASHPGSHLGDSQLSAPTLADGAGLVRDQAIKLRPAEVEQWEDGGLLLRYMVDQT